MNFHSERFGDITIEDNELLAFPNGLVGFPNEKEFVLLRQREGSSIAWLHSTTNAALAFPVISLDALSMEYKEADVLAAADAAGIGGTLDMMSVMLVFAAPGRGIPPTVNLVAPIIVSAETRTGAQVLVEGMRLSTCEPLSAWMRVEEKPAPAANPRPRRAPEMQMAAEEG